MGLKWDQKCLLFLDGLLSVSSPSGSCTGLCSKLCHSFFEASLQQILSNAVWPPDSCSVKRDRGSPDNNATVCTGRPDFNHPREPKDYKREKKKKEWGIAKDRDWWVSLAIKAEKGGLIAFSVENGGLIPTESPYNGQHHWVFRVMHTWAWEWSHTVQGFAAQTASVTSTSMHGGEGGGRMGWGEVGTNK